MSTGGLLNGGYILKPLPNFYTPHVPHSNKTESLTWRLLSIHERCIVMSVIGHDLLLGIYIVRALMVSLSKAEPNNINKMT